MLRESSSSLWASCLPLGYPSEELQVLKCFEKGQGDQFLEEFSFPGGPWRNFACTLYPLSGENKCTLLCISWNCVLLATYISSCGAVCFWVLLTPVVLQWLWIFCLVWFEAELLRTMCVCRNSRLENERLVGSKSFLKVWECRPEKGREIFLKVYQCFTWTRIAGREYWQSDLRISVAA